MFTLIKAGVRLVIIFMFVQLLDPFARALSGFYSLWDTYTKDFITYLYLAATIGIPLIGALILCILWRKTDWLVTKLAGDISENELVINTSNLDLITVVMRIVGIVLVLTSIPELAGLIVYRSILANVYSDWFLAENARAEASEIMRWITVIGTLLIGLWLALGSKGIIRVFNTIWNYMKNTE